jgi:ABC-2 type transport system ATP-binding protein
MSHVIEVQNLSQAYEPGRPVLKGLSVQVGQGEVVGLLGRNGAGKTTLLRSIAGIMAVQSGKVSVFGLDPFENGIEVKQRFGYVAEDQILPAYLSVKQVLDMHRGLFPTWDEDLCRSLSDRFNIRPDQMLGAMSKGQARQVALLCAIAHRPELLLLDEPAGGLDPATRRGFLEAAIELLSEHGSTIVFSSHYMSDVERIASRVVLVDDGDIKVDEGIDALRENYMLAMLSDVNEAAFSRLDGLGSCISVRRHGKAVHAVFRDSEVGVNAALQQITNGAPVDCRRLPLEDLFIEVVEASR